MTRATTFPEVDHQQQLVAVGGVHLATGLVGSFPISSSGSRTALAIASGARTQAYSLVAAGRVVLVLFSAGPHIAPMPAAAPGATVLYAAGMLVSIPDFVWLTRFRQTELALALALVALVGTVVLGILAGVGLAIGLGIPRDDPAAGPPAPSSGRSRGRAATRRFLSWDATLSPRAVTRDAGVGVLVSGSTVTWEREFELSAEGVPYREESLAVIEFDDAGLIRRIRSYYDKLAVLDQIAQRLPGPSGWVFRRLTGYLIRMGSKGLPPSDP